MFSITEDPIAAIVTPPGVGGVGIVRVSGNNISNIVEAILKNPQIMPNVAMYTDFLSEHQEVIDSGIAIYFKAPKSFTGEDILELQGHGGPVVLNLLLRRVLDLGARIAEPGEFSRRAFLHGKMDLLQAESIVSLINAQTEEAAKAAVKSLQGDFSKQINILLQQLITLRIYVEAAIDFPEDDIDILEKEQIVSKSIQLEKQVYIILQQAKQGSLLSNALKVVILGEPNVGKSSLLNLLSGDDKAIVTDLPGTTRDVVTTTINLDGLMLDFSDTAGIRETRDVIESIGIQKAIKATAAADLVLLMTSAKILENNHLDVWLEEMFERDYLLNKKVVVLINKIDLYNVEPKVVVRDRAVLVFASVKNQVGVEELKQQIKEKTGFSGGSQLFTARTRHVVALEKVLQHLKESVNLLKKHKVGSLELFAEELRLAQEFLSQLTGTFTSEDLLDQIFSEFCIGK